MQDLVLKKEIQYWCLPELKINILSLKYASYGLVPPELSKYYIIASQNKQNIFYDFSVPLIFSIASWLFP